MKKELNMECLFCGKHLAEYDYKKEDYNPKAEELYESGAVPVPNLGWFCTQGCATDFEQRNNLQFERDETNKIDYYK